MVNFTPHRSVPWEKTPPPQYPLGGPHSRPQRCGEETPLLSQPRLEPSAVKLVV